MNMVRVATLADAAAISEVHRSDVPAWMRYGTDGTGSPAVYEDLSLAERFGHGGAWMSVELCAVHLYRALNGGVIPLVVEHDGKVVGEAEIQEVREALPFGHHMEVTMICVHNDYRGQGFGRALMDYIIRAAQAAKCQRVTVSDADEQGFYEKVGFRLLRTGRAFRVTTVAGRVLYQSSTLPETLNFPKEWQLTFGRYRSSKAEWDRLFAADWGGALPELSGTAYGPYKLNAAGQNAIFAMYENTDPGAPAREAKFALWAPRAATGQIVTAIRDWAARNQWATLTSIAYEQELNALPADAELLDEQHAVFEYPITAN